MCLARTDWDAPKHRGLTWFAVPTDAEGVTVRRITQINGDAEFCEEFFDDVVLPAENLIGELNGGWAVAQTLLFHERNATGSIGYGYLGNLGGRRRGGNLDFGALGPDQLAREATRRGVGGAVATLVADAYIASVVNPLTSARIMTGMRVGTHQGQWGSLLKLQGSESSHETARTGLAALGADAVIWEGEDVALDNPGTAWLGSRGGTIAGGTSEMQRNIISERLLGLPREPAVDRDIPFNEVLRNLGKASS
jgi:alkylation response protein AidB-like acyl-CoA dehydrogenase